MSVQGTGEQAPDHIPVVQADMGVYGWHSMPSDQDTMSDYPLFATCQICKRPIQRMIITQWWEHRPPDAALPDSPADSSL